MKLWNRQKRGIGSGMGMWLRLLIQNYNVFMYTIDQSVANQIAKTQKLSHTKMWLLFKATELEAEAMETAERKRISEIAGDPVARAWIAYAPLFLENAALTKFIREFPSLGLRAMIPEILTADEAASIAQQDLRLTEEETFKLKELLVQEVQMEKEFRDEIDKLVQIIFDGEKPSS